MKNKLTLALSFLTIITLSACSKNCCDTPQANFIHAQKDTKDWNATPDQAAVYQDTLYIFGRIKEETLVMKIKFTGVGKYVLTPSQALYEVTIGGDVVSVSYLGDNTTQNLLNIINYDAPGKTISGNFSINMDRSYRYAGLDAYYPQKIAFTNGSFNIKLSK